MKAIVDRIEGEYLIVEISPNNIVNIPREFIMDAIEGDILNINVDYKARNKKDKIVQNLMDNLFE